MANWPPGRSLPKALQKQLRSALGSCPFINIQIANLSDYFAVIESQLGSGDPFWYRGHGSINWSLSPSALRYTNVNKRKRALDLISVFRRTAEIKLDKPPGPNEHLKWAQIAQHYGLPTRLLDWTQNAAIGLYFACRKDDEHGGVFAINPIDLNKRAYPKKPRVFDPHEDIALIQKHLLLGPKETSRGRPTIAIYPVWNSERILLQQGVFTLHGSKAFALTKAHTPSLLCIPVMKEHKSHLLNELDRIGVNEMAIFPEIEHLCHHLKWTEDLLHD